MKAGQTLLRHEQKVNILYISRMSDSQSHLPAPTQKDIRLALARQDAATIARGEESVVRSEISGGMMINMGLELEDLQYVAFILLLKILTNNISGENLRRTPSPWGSMQRLCKKQKSLSVTMGFAVALPHGVISKASISLERHSSVHLTHSTAQSTHQRLKCMSLNSGFHRPLVAR